MHNPMLVAVVAHALKTCGGRSSQQFQSHILSLLKALKAANSLEDVEWYDSVYADLSSKVPGELLPDIIIDFCEILGQIQAEQLIPACNNIRIELWIENCQPLHYTIKSVYATFTVQWVDGLQVEYNCRPFNIKPSQLEIPGIAHLSHLFADQFIEASVQPGLDTFHDQVAKPFDLEKFEELTQVMQKWVNEKPAAEREDYQHILVRLCHQFGPGPEIKLLADNKPLEFIEDGGGFSGP